MTPWRVCWGIFLFLALELTVKAQVPVDDHGYPISFPQNVPSSEEIRNKRSEISNSLPRIVDLYVNVIKYYKNVIISWTNPVGVKDITYDIKIFKTKEDALSRFDTTGWDVYTTDINIRATRTSVLLPCERLIEGLTYFMALRYRDEFDKLSELSNIVEFLPRPIETTTTEETRTSEDDRLTNPDPAKGGNNVLGIALGVLGGVAALVLLVSIGYYFFVKKPQRYSECRR